MDELATIQGLTRLAKTDPPCINADHLKWASQDQLTAYRPNPASCAAEYRNSYRPSGESAIDAQA
jgi:hypothetical protein